MVHYQTIHCPHCQGTDLYKNGNSVTGTPRWFCKECRKYFQLNYRYNACKQGIKEKIIEMTLNSSGVRDIGRVLSISKDTVTTVLKKNAKNEPLFSHKRRKEQVGWFGSWDTVWRRDGWVLEFRAKQIQSTLDMVRHRKKKRLHISLAQRKKARQGLSDTLAIAATVSNRCLSYRWLGLLFEIHSCRYASDWEGQHLENRAEKPEFQNTYKTVESKNNLLFKKRTDTWQCHRNVYWNILL